VSDERTRTFLCLQHHASQNPLVLMVTFAALLAFVLASCGSSAGPGPGSASTPTPTPTPDQGYGTAHRFSSDAVVTSEPPAAQCDGHALGCESHAHGSRWGCHRNPMALWTPLVRPCRFRWGTAIAHACWLRFAIDRDVYLALECAAYVVNDPRNVSSFCPQTWFCPRDAQRAKLKQI
jgi:hypothetical protein